MRKRSPIYNAIAHYYYFLITEFLNSPDNKNGEHFFLLLTHLKDFFKEILKHENQHFPSDFSRMVFIFDKFNVSFKIRREIKTIFKTSKLIQHDKSTNLDELSLASCLSFSKLINNITAVAIPTEILNKTNKYETFFNFTEEPIAEYIKQIKATVRDIKTTSLLLELYDDNPSPVLFETGYEWLDIINQVWVGCDIELINIVKKNDIYTTTITSLIVIEPDYLYDATELAESFTFYGYSPYIPIVKNLKVFNSSPKLVVGNIVNSIFDILLSNPGAEFDDIYLSVLKNKYLPLFAVTMHEQAYKKYIREETYKQYLSLKNTLRKFILERISIEPSFISPTYGIQGRLDLLSESYSETNRKDIVELKSGRPARIDERFVYEGTFVKTGVYINHLAQVTAYNILLDSCYKNRKGASLILYSQTENESLRNVPNILQIKKLLIKSRNALIKIEHRLSLRDYSVFEELIHEADKLNANWLKNEFTFFYNTYANQTDIARSYFNHWVTFVYNELYASKLGNDNDNKGFAELWRTTIQEKIINNRIIANLTLNAEKSDFEKMYLSFNYTNENLINPPFGKGDICVLYPNDSNNQFHPSNGRLIKCTIREITKNSILVTLRNKMQYEIFANSHISWIIDYDHSDSITKSMLTSLAYFINASPKKQDIILGLSKPQTLDDYIPDCLYLNESKNKILKKALNSKDYFIIQGPPGTGKTNFMLRAIVDILYHSTQENILILAYTNRAVDEICSALKRIKTTDAVPEKNKFSFIRFGNKDSSEHKDVLLSEIIETIDVNETFKLIKKTRIFLATSSYALMNPDIFKLKHFHTIIVDEASQILEVNLSGLLTKSDRFILIGDEKQLPAIVLQSKKLTEVSDESLNSIGLENLDNSLFERLLLICKTKNWEHSYALISEQGRMHADVMDFSNRYFYDSQLTILDNKAQKSTPELFSNTATSLEKLLYNNRFIFINCEHEPYSKCNLSEASCAVQLIQSVANAYGERFNEQTIGVISPFRLQCSTIKKSLPEELHKFVAIDTVEKFQGSERDVIIISFAVNHTYLLNNAQSVKVIDNKVIDRKLNVALTRAKSHVVILGNEQTLKHSMTYSELINYTKNKGSFVQLSQLVKTKD